MGLLALDSNAYGKLLLLSEIVTTAFGILDTTLPGAGLAICTVANRVEAARRGRPQSLNSDYASRVSPAVVSTEAKENWFR